MPSSMLTTRKKNNLLLGTRIQGAVTHFVVFVAQGYFLHRFLFTNKIQHKNNQQIRLRYSRRTKTVMETVSHV